MLFALCCYVAVGASFSPQAWASDKHPVPGTYVVTANISVSAADASAAGFPVLAGLAGKDGSAYMTNPANPMGIGGVTGLPTSPVSDNATLEVAPDGTATLVVPVVNPVFTLQKLGTNGQLSDFSSSTTSGSFGNYQTRISEVRALLPDVHSRQYVLAGCGFHPTILKDTYDIVTVNLVLSLDAGSVETATPVAVPLAVESLVENGQVQQGVPEGEGYTLDGAQAMAAGSYTARAVLAKGYVWSDGTFDDKEIAWSIAAASSETPGKEGDGKDEGDTDDDPGSSDGGKPSGGGTGASDSGSNGSNAASSGGKVPGATGTTGKADAGKGGSAHGGGQGSSKNPGAGSGSTPAASSGDNARPSGDSGSARNDSAGSSGDGKGKDSGASGNDLGNDPGNANAGKGSPSGGSNSVAQNPAAPSVGHGSDNDADSNVSSARDTGSDSAARKAGTLNPGTYKVTANIWLKASDATKAGFPVLEGIVGANGAAYMTNSANPLGAEGGTEGVPIAPVEGNAQLVVGTDGTFALSVPVTNPVFTMQKLGDSARLTGERSSTKMGSYGVCSSRIDHVSVVLPDLQDRTYVLAGSAFHPAILPEYGVVSVPLNLTVALADAQPVNAATGAGQETPNAGQATSGAAPGAAPGAAGSGQPAERALSSQTEGEKASEQGSAPSASGAAALAARLGESATAASGGDSAGSAPTSGNVRTSADGRLSPGTYTVSANIWVNKDTSGLPLQPHFTNAAFPPMNPVGNNATLRVDSAGRAFLTVPIVIQDRIMSVRSIEGLPIVDSTVEDGALKSITLDLGVLTSKDAVVTMPCTAQIQLGSLASTIIGGARDRTWEATFQMNFKGIPESGGGSVPAAVQEIIQNAGADGRAADAQERADDARNAALGALSSNGTHDTDGAQASGGASSRVSEKAGSSRSGASSKEPQKGGARTGSGAADSDIVEALTEELGSATGPQGPGPAIASLVVLVAALAAGGAFAIMRKKRKPESDQAENL